MPRHTGPAENEQRPDSRDLRVLGQLFGFLGILLALPVAAALAKAFCSDTYFRCAAESVQIHGGVGFSWEYDVHLYFKRANSTEILFGSPAYHRERVAQRMGL